MGERHIHRAVSADGTEIAGRVHGQGPPLLLVHGGAGDGEVSWRFLMPELADRFTCYAMSTRGRGLSGDHPDHSVEALVGDVVTLAESIREPVGVVGHSSSLALAAAARTNTIVAVAVHEPAVPALLGDDPRPAQAIARLVAAGEGRHAEAARIFFEDSGLFDDEAATVARLGTYDMVAPNVPAWTQEMPEYAGAVAPEVLAGVDVPVLLLRGAQSPEWFRASVHHVATHLSDVEVREVPGAGHMAPVLAPGPVAARLREFFGSVPRFPPA